jgi:hypothetical protein
MYRITKKKVGAFVAAALLVCGAGAAYAFWTAGGTGDGTVTTGTTSGITVNQTSTITGLAPGSGPQTLSGDFDNSNSAAVFVTSVSVTVVSTDSAGCGPTDYTVGGTAVVDAQVPSGVGVGSWSGLTIQFNNKVSVNQDACKGAVVTLAYTSN